MGGWVGGLAFHHRGPLHDVGFGFFASQTKRLGGWVGGWVWVFFFFFSFLFWVGGWVGGWDVRGGVEVTTLIQRI